MCTHAKYEQYLDGIYGQGYGAKLKESDPTMFCMGYYEWALQEECFDKDEESCLDVLQ